MTDEVLTEVASPARETLDAWGGQLLGRFTVLASEAEYVQAEETEAECPLCFDPLFHLFAEGGRFWRTVAQVQGTDSLVVDVLPPTMRVLACRARCDVAFYERDTHLDD